MKNFTLITLIGFILFMANGITGPVSSLYAESLGASYVAIGMLGTVTSLTAIFFSYVWGQASDRLGQRKVFLTWGLVVLAAAYGLKAIVPSYGFLYLLHFLSGMAHTAYATSSLALMGDLLDDRSRERGRRMGVYRGLASLGFGLMAFISGSVADRLSLRVPFFLAAAFAIMALILALYIQEPTPQRPRETAQLSLRLLWPSLKTSLAGAARAMLAQMSALFSREVKREREAAGTAAPTDAATSPVERGGRLPLAPLLISAFLWSLVTGAVYAVWANYMVGEIGYAPAQMSRLWAMASLSEFPLMIVAGWLSDRIGRLPMLSLGFVAWTLVFLGYLVAPQMPWIMATQLIRGFAYSAFTATAMTYATEVRARGQRGQASGLYHSANGIGAILGSSMGGALTQWLGFRLMIAINAALILGGAVYLAVVAVRHKIQTDR